MKKELKNTQQQYKNSKDIFNIIHGKLDLIDEVIDLVNCDHPQLHPIDCNCKIFIK